MFPVVVGVNRDVVLIAPCFDSQSAVSLFLTPDCPLGEFGLM